MSEVSFLALFTLFSFLAVVFIEKGMLAVFHFVSVS